MMTAIDILVVLVVLVAAWNGYRAGFVIELAGLARTILGVIVGVRFFAIPAAWLLRQVPAPQALANIGAFFALFVATQVLVTLLYSVTLYPAADLLHRVPALGGLDRLLGIVPAALQGIFWVALALAAALLLPLGPAIQDGITQSTLGNALVVDLSRFEPKLQTLLGNAAQATLLYLTPPASQVEGTVHLHFPANLPITTDNRAEQTMFAYLNTQRARNGLPPLQLDPTLSAVARGHSADMFRRSYFSHDAPDGQTPFDRMHAAGVVYGAAGENIAYAPTVGIADTGLMNSPEHRANILRPTFTRVGVGVVSGGLFEEMFTQDFAD